jgi:capsular polysaccharide biosynthesis protein
MRFKVKKKLKKFFASVLFTNIEGSVRDFETLLEPEQICTTFTIDHVRSKEVHTLRKIKMLTGYRLILKQGRLVTDPWINEDGVIKLLKRPGVIRSFFFELIGFRKAQRIESAFYFASRHGTKISAPNYAHFLLEDLPILKVWLEKYRTSKLVIRADSPIWISEILSVFEIFEQDCFDKNSLLLVDQLLVFPKPFFSSHKYESNSFRIQMIEQIKMSVLKIRVEQKVEKLQLRQWIFIGRHSESRRKIENHEEMLKILKKFGFTIIDPASYPFVDQVKIFSNCTLLLGQSGAALVNGCFMSARSSLIELNHGEADEGPTCWELMSREFGINYETIYPINSVVDHDQDITVDISSLDKMLTRLDKNLL